VTSPAAKETAAPITSVEAVATEYLHAMFKKDLATMARLFPTSRPDPERDEYLVDLVKLTVKEVAPAEAADNNPVTRWEYAKATADVTAKGKKGVYQFTVGTVVVDGRRVVTMVGRSASWEK
jgi:hypothetical protein